MFIVIILRVSVFILISSVGGRSFPVAGSTIWNQLPIDVIYSSLLPELSSSGISKHISFVPHITEPTFKHICHYLFPCFILVSLLRDCGSIFKKRETSSSVTWPVCSGIYCRPISSGTGAAPPHRITTTCLLEYGIIIIHRHWRCYYNFYYLKLTHKFVFPTCAWCLPGVYTKCLHISSFQLHFNRTKIAKYVRNTCEIRAHKVISSHWVPSCLQVTECITDQ